MKTVINKHGYEVEAPTRAKLHYAGTSCKIGDTVYPIGDFDRTSVKVRKGTPLVVKLMWKNKYGAVLEFEGTELSASSILFHK